MTQTTPQPADNSQPKSNGPAMQGEGNYEAAQNCRDSVETFIEEGKVGPAAKAAKPEDAQTAEALKQAEAEGKSHAKR